jgi:hypothetical protein
MAGIWSGTLIKHHRGMHARWDVPSVVLPPEIQAVFLYAKRQGLLVPPSGVRPFAMSEFWSRFTMIRTNGKY